MPGVAAPVAARVESRLRRIGLGGTTMHHLCSVPHEGRRLRRFVTAMTCTAVAACATQPTPMPEPPPEPPPPAVAPEPAEDFGVVHTCNADYPPEAGGVEGRVQMTFQVGIEGKPFNIAVETADPPGVFDDVAMTALACGHFQPELDTSRVRRVVIEFVP